MQEELNQLCEQATEDLQIDIYRIKQMLTPKLLQTVYNNTHNTKIAKDNFSNVQEVLRNYFSLEMMEKLVVSESFLTNFAQLTELNSIAKLILLYSVSQVTRCAAVVSPLLSQTNSSWMVYMNFSFHFGF